MATLLLLDWYTYASLTKDMDAAMHGFSADLRRRFSQEVREAHNVLATFTDERQKELPWLGKTELEGHLLCTNILSPPIKCAAACSYANSGRQILCSSVLTPPITCAAGGTTTIPADREVPSRRGCTRIPNPPYLSE